MASRACKEKRNWSNEFVLDEKLTIISNSIDRDYLLLSIVLAALALLNKWKIAIYAINKIDAIIALWGKTYKLQNLDLLLYSLEIFLKESQYSYGKHKNKSLDLIFNYG